MRWITCTLIAGVGLCVAASCGGSTGSGNGGGGDFGAAWTQFCKDDAARDQKCGGTPDEASCTAAQSCMQASWRTDALPPLLSCLTARECGTSDDPCFTQAGQAVPQNATTQAYFSACTSWWQQCGGSDDYCSASAALLSDATLSAMTACMKKPCTEADTCLDPVVGKLDCW